jgi:hypothetical protein
MEFVSDLNKQDKNSVSHDDKITPDNSLNTDTHSFIIRVWHESQDSDGNILAWRGSIDHVGSNKRLYFQNLDGIAQFIQEQSGVCKARNSSTWRAPLIWIENEINKLRK